MQRRESTERCRVSDHSDLPPRLVSAQVGLGRLGVKFTIACFVSLSVLWLQPVWGGSVPDLLDASLPAVVTVTVEKTASSTRPMGFAGSASDVAYGTWPSLGNYVSSGSGFIIVRGSRAYVVTNFHVVDNAGKEPDAVFSHDLRGRKYRMKLIGGDIFYDVALLEFLDPPDSELVGLSFRSGPVRVGESVFAIGNPWGTNPYEVTDGIVSAKNRVGSSINSEGYYMYGYLHTTAQASPGNSGGPLLGADGTVVGIITAIMHIAPESLQQTTLALEAALVDKAIQDFITNEGRVRRSYLGLQIEQRAVYTGKQLSRTEPVTLIDVMTGSPAGGKLVGMEGAQIRQVNRYTISSIQGLLWALEQVRPGEEINLVLFKNQVERTVTVRTGELTAEALAVIAKHVVVRFRDVTLVTGGRTIEGVAFAKREPGPLDNRQVASKKGEMTYIGVGEMDQSGGFSGFQVNTWADLGAAMRLSALEGKIPLIVREGEQVTTDTIVLAGSENALRGIVARTVLY